MIGPYRLLDHLGQGGMGDVYRGYDTRLRRTVALKRIRESAAHKERARRRFAREAQTIAQLNHPSIVQIYDWVEAEGSDWLVMEFMKGRALSEIKDIFPLGLEETLRISVQISAGLRAAHREGIVHRDLKLSNVMRLEDGTIKILDFGIAKRLEDAEEFTDRSSMTQEGEVIGSLPAMSPEQALGRNVDHRSDLFSLGSLMYQVLTGHAPFAGRTAAEVLTLICTYEPPALLEVDVEIPKALSSLVERLMKKEPEFRPSTADDVVQELENLLERFSKSDLLPMPGSEEEDLSLIETIGADSSAIMPPASESAVAVGSSAALRRSLLEARARGSIALALLFLLLLGFGSYQLMMNEAPEESMKSGPELETPHEYFARGMDTLRYFYRPGQVQRAMVDFRHAIALDVDYAPAYSGLAAACFERYSGLGDEFWLEQAEHNVRKALELNPQLTSAQAVQGRILLGRGEVDQAKRAFDEVLVLDPNNVVALVGLGDLALSQGEPLRAIELFHRASELDPESTPVLSRIGVIYYRQAEFEKAEDVFARGIELDPSDTSNYKNLAAVYHLQGRYPEASRLLQKALEIFPEPAVYANLGTLYFFQGLYQQALAAFLEAVDLEPNNFQNWGNLGDAHRQLPDSSAEAREAFQTAIPLLEKALETHPKDGYLQATMAEYQAKAEQPAPALERLALLAERKDLEPGPLFRASLAAEIAGNRDLALDFLRRSLDSGYPELEIGRDPELVGLRRDARFRRLMTDFRHQASQE